MRRLGSLNRIPPMDRPNRWADHRRFGRERVSGRVVGLKLRGIHHIVRLHNISAGGVCIDLPGQPRIGELVRIVLGRHRRAGRVCWSARGRAGIEFIGG
jgi:hypothetical protein